MSNLNTATNNPPVLFNKAEIKRRICSHAAAGLSSATGLITGLVPCLGSEDILDCPLKA